MTSKADYQRHRYKTDPEYRRRHVESQKKWNAKHQDEIKKYRRNWAKADRKKKYAKYRQEELRKKYRKYGLSDGWYEAQFAKQSGLCAICGEPETHLHNMTKSPVPLSIDHNHATQQIRGLLCWRCNLNLHQVEDSGWLAKALIYLRGFTT